MNDTKNINEKRESDFAKNQTPGAGFILPNAGCTMQDAIIKLGMI